MNILKRNNKILTRGGLIMSSYEATGPSYPTDGLLGRWTFDNTLADSYGSNDFVRISGSSDSYAAGVSGNALSFDGTKQYQIDNSSLLTNINGTGSYSLSFWFYTSYTSSNYWHVFGIGNNAGGNDAGVATALIATGTWAGLGKSLTALRNGDWSWHKDAYTPSSWIHWVITYDGTTQKVYQDNTFVSQTSGWNGGQTSTGSLTGLRYVSMATGGDGGKNYKIQYAYLYDSELSSDDRAALYNSGTPI